MVLMVVIVLRSVVCGADSVHMGGGDAVVVDIDGSGDGGCCCGSGNRVYRCYMLFLCIFKGKDIKEKM